MLIGSAIAIVGSIGAFLLVRQRDFVPSFAPPAEPAPPVSAEAEAR
jgi:hypothetical protein